MNGAGGVGLTPTLFASAFSDPNAGNTHAASQWQVSTASNFVALVWDSGQDAVHLTNVATPYLPYETRCYWRVRYKDNTGLWGAYSNPTWFDTLTRPHVYVWTNRADGSWTTPGNWMPYGYPNDAADTAVISNQLLGSGTTRSIYVNANVTAGVIRTTGFIASNIYASIKTQNASTLCLKGAAGNALVELAGHCAASWGLEINVPFALLSDVDVRATSNKILTLSASYIAGTNNLHLDAAAGFLASRIGGSPAFTGKVYTERSVNTVLMQSQSFTYTNATIVVKSGATLNVGNAARLGQLVLMPGSRLDAYWSSPSSNDNSVTVLGLVTNTAQANSWMNFRGDVRGTGMVIRLNGSGIGTNRFIGSISPGIDGIGRLVLDERLGVTEFGQAGARLRLNIDVSGSGAVPGVDHDQLVLSNQDAALSLQNTDLVLDGALSGTATNWILTVHSNLLNGTAFNSVTNRSGQSAAVVYDYPNNRVGVFSLASTNAIIVSTSSVSVPEGSTAGFSVKLMNPPNGTFTVSVSRVSGDTDISVQSGATLYFTAGNYDTWQPVTLSAAQDDDAADGSATVRCSGAGVGDVNVTATEDDNDTLGITTSTGSVNVPEGSTAGFDVKLTAAPVGTATVTVSRISGDTSISVQSGGTLYFTAGNWSSWQAVTLSAAEDADYTNGIAAIRCAASGMTSVDVIATEVDNDSELPPGTYVWTNAVGGNWTVAGNWSPNGYPNGPGDTAVFPHENLSGTGSRTIYVDADVTAKAVRITGTIGADLHPTIASSGGKRLHLASNAGNAVIEGAGVNAGSWQADITAPLVLLSDVDLVVPSNKIMAVRSSYFEGTNTMNLRAIAGLIAFRVNGSPDFTGVLCAEQTTASLLFQSQSYMCTNATIVVKGGTTLNLGNAARLGDLVLEPASRLDAYWSSPSSNDNRVTIQGVVTNAAQYSSWMEFRGDVRGEGTLVKINSNPNGTNRFTGSIAPGVDGIGILTLDEQAGVTELGLPGDRLLLNIDVNGSGGVPGVDHDQVIVSNLDVSLTLDTIDLDIDGSLGGTATNWFLTVHSNLVNGTTFNSVTFGGALSAQLVYDYANSRVGVVPGASTNALILSADTVDVPEGSTATFNVKLAYPPAGALTVSTARISGDADLGVSGGAALVFNAGNYSSWQTVTLSADEDGDVDDGSATFRCSAPNTDPDDVIATEQDNDTLVTVSFQQGVSPVGYAGTYDTYLRSGSYSNSNYGTATTLSIRGGYNALVKWDVSAIPTGAIVQSASVQFRVSTAASGAMADIYESKRAWTETGATWVRWNTAIGGTYWQLQGGTGVLDKGSVVFGSFSMASRVTVSNNLGGEGVACVQRWVSNPATNTGFIILRRSGTTSAAVCSRNYSTTSYRPKLTVTYIVGPGGASPQGVPFTGVERTTVAPSSRDSADAQMANAFVADTAVAASNRFVVAGRIDAQTVPDSAPLPVRVTVGGQSESLKAGHWRAVSSGVYVYRLPLGEPGMVRAMRLDYDRGKWLVRGELVRARAAGEPVVVTIGIDGVNVDVRCLPER
ncbi:DNRLRE domain-containing protein [bacterium]|nr:DNRLRE domain-containing protein [bacterium]